MGQRGKPYLRSPKGYLCSRQQRQPSQRQQMSIFPVPPESVSSARFSQDRLCVFSALSCYGSVALLAEAACVND